PTQTNPENAAMPGTPPFTVLSENPGPAGSRSSARNDATTNYEVDRTISHIKEPVGKLQRLSAAVVVNYREIEGEQQPLTPSELENLNNLVKQAMGFDATRGDTLSVINSPFSDQQI